MRPLAAGEWRTLDYYQPAVEVRILIRRNIRRIPRLQVAEYTQAKVPRHFVLRKINPDCGVVIGFVGHLNWIGEAGREFLLRVISQPERKCSLCGTHVLIA